MSSLLRRAVLLPEDPPANADDKLIDVDQGISEGMLMPSMKHWSALHVEAGKQIGVRQFRAAMKGVFEKICLGCLGQRAHAASAKMGVRQTELLQKPPCFQRKATKHEAAALQTREGANIKLGSCMLVQRAYTLPKGFKRHPHGYLLVQVGERPERVKRRRVKWVAVSDAEVRTVGRVKIRGSMKVIEEDVDVAVPVYEYAHRMVKWGINGPPWFEINPEEQPAGEIVWSENVMEKVLDASGKEVERVKYERYRIVHHVCGHRGCLNPLHLQWAWSDEHTEHHRQLSWGFVPGCHKYDVRAGRPRR
jgi:hypothetical protein